MKAVEVGRLVGVVLNSANSHSRPDAAPPVSPDFHAVRGEQDADSQKAGPKTEKPSCVFTRAAVITKRRYVSLAIYFKRLKGINREVRPHRLASVCWEEEQLSELLPPFVAWQQHLATPVPTSKWGAKVP
jgi:hypothetical protein